MKGNLLWVYEGLTEYLGTILTARAGFYDGPLAREDFAMAAQAMREARGRTSRPLADTAVSAQLLYPAREDWAGLRRSVDFYMEGQLIWLEADVRIRQKTHGAKSLDDFCKLFFGGESSSPQVVPYSLSDVLAALNKVSPDDWEAFFNQRINEVSDDAAARRNRQRRLEARLRRRARPALEGHRQVAQARRSAAFAGHRHRQRNEHDPGHRPWQPRPIKAGLSPGMKLIAIGGHRYSHEALQTAVEVSKSVTTPITLLIENADNFASTNVDYHGGPSYPTLERNGDKPDLLSAIFAPSHPSHRADRRNYRRTIEELSPEIVAEIVGDDHAGDEAGDIGGESGDQRVAVLGDADRAAVDAQDVEGGLGGALQHRAEAAGVGVGAEVRVAQDAGENSRRAAAGEWPHQRERKDLGRDAERSGDRREEMRDRLHRARRAEGPDRRENRDQIGKNSQRDREAFLGPLDKGLVDLDAADISICGDTA